MSLPNLKTDFARLQLPLMLGSILALLFSACESSTVKPADESTVRKFILLRHAEKEASTSDPALSPEGRSRTEFLARWVGAAGQGYKAVWSSDYRRTRDTAGPIAESLGANIQIYDPRDLSALAETLLEAEVNAVVVGHSNTTPELAVLLCQCEVAPMSENDYEHGYLVVFLDERRDISQLDFQKLWLDRPATNPVTSD